MDVLMTFPANGQPWTAKLIEFNGFGAHLDTGSDLFHWVKDADHLQGKTPGFTVRFVDDWENAPSLQDETVTATPSESVSLDEDEPDWLVLGKQLHAKLPTRWRMASGLNCRFGAVGAVRISRGSGRFALRAAAVDEFGEVEDERKRDTGWGFSYAIRLCHQLPFIHSFTNSLLSLLTYLFPVAAGGSV
jgi:hypothetical protein